MTLAYDDGQARFYLGDVRAVLREIEAESVQTVVTSPPYWSLRDYGTPGQLGLEETPAEYVCAMVEVFREVRRVLRPDGTLWLNLGDSYASGGTGGYSDKSTLAGFTNPETKGRVMNGTSVTRSAPPGLKPKDLVGIPWRVAFALQADGWWLRQDIIWSKPNPMPESVTDRCTKAHEMLFLLSKSERYFYDADAIREGVDEASVIAGANSNGESFVFGQDLGLKNTSSALTSVCVRLAASVLDIAKRQNNLGLFALDAEIGDQRADGLAGFPVVHVPVVGRAAAQAARFSNGDVSAKEFLGEMNRLCVALPDGDDLKEAWRLTSLHVSHIDTNGDAPVAINDAGEVSQIKRIHHEHSTISRVPSSHMKDTPRNDGERWREADGGVSPRGSRNRRSVWTIPTSPLKEAHFATFPPALVEPCILAGTSEHGCCSVCGAPWERVTEKTYRSPIVLTGTEEGRYEKGRGRNVTRMGDGVDVATTGWRAACAHTDAPVRPAVVLDPFLGSGTTAMVAKRLGRRAVGIDLNAEYLEMAKRRCSQMALMGAGK